MLGCQSWSLCPAKRKQDANTRPVVNNRLSLVEMHCHKCMTGNHEESTDPDCFQTISLFLGGFLLLQWQDSQINRHGDKEKHSYNADFSPDIALSGFNSNDVVVLSRSACVLR